MTRLWRAAGLLGDLVLGRLIAHSDAFAVGRKAGRIAPGLQAEFDAPSRRVGKRKYDDEERRARDSAAAAAEKAELRRQQVELPLTSLPAAAPLQPPAAPCQPPAPARPGNGPPRKKQRVTTGVFSCVSGTSVMRE